MWISNNFLLYIIMAKRTSKRRQKLYKMKGCSNTKTKKNRKHSRKYLGGTSSKSAYPNLGPSTLPGTAVTPTNQGNGMKGGGCPLCSGGGMRGGGCGMRGGGCGMTGNGMTGNGMRGGGCGCGANLNMTGGAHTLEPAGLVGDPWTPNPSGWPGVDGIAGNRNYLDYNSYKADPQTAMVSVGANRPFLFGGKKSNRPHKRSHKRLHKFKKINHKGGAMSNLFGQDIINLGRQAQFGLGSAYNAINGYSAPTNPLPWKGQLPNTPDLNSIKSMNL